jgi:predicted DNA-binding protein (UPF0251 family)
MRLLLCAWHSIAAADLDTLPGFSDIDYEHRFISSMARPFKQRFVGPHPKVTTFKPQGIPVTELDILMLTLDELEAIRLADLEGDDQERAAMKMHISRPTFGRILERGHRVVADALFNGKAIQIGGGPVVSARRGKVRCRRCRRAWDIPLAVATDFRCPRCATKG